MHSVLRSAAGRAAGAFVRRGYATAAATPAGAGAERERVAALVKQEVRTQLLLAKEAEEAAARLRAEASSYARLRAAVADLDPWTRGYWTGYGVCFVSAGMVQLMLFPLFAK